MMDWLLFLANEYLLSVTAVTATVCYVGYYYVRVVKVPQLISKEGEWLHFLQEAMPILKESFRPTPWCVDGRLQSVLPTLVRWWLPEVPYQREVLKLKDGGIMSIDWTGRPNRRDQPIVVMLPGLTGSSQSGYIKGFVHSLRQENVCCLAINYRGMSNTELKTTRTFCKANFEDLEEVLVHVRSSYPDAPVIAVGVSLGGMWVTNYLATRGAKASKYVDAAIVFSTLWDLYAANESLETPVLNVVINYALTRLLCQIYDGHKKRLDGPHYAWSTERVMKCKTIRQFDDRFTSRNFGYSGVDEYYRASRLYDKIGLVKVPLLCVTAEDDFFQPLEGVPVMKALESSHVAFLVTSHGGHAGFMEGFLPCETFYSDRVFSQFVRGVLSRRGKDTKFKRMGNEHVQNAAG